MNRSSIRKAVNEDAEQIVDLVNAAYRPPPGTEGWTHEAALVTGNRVDLAQVNQALADSVVLVAVHGTQVVGCIQIQILELEAQIGMLAVLPGMQTAGLGKKLLAEAERFVDANQGVQQLVLLVVAERRELIDFYLRRGYAETGEFKAYPVDAGVGTPLNANSRLAILRKPVDRK